MKFPKHVFATFPNFSKLTLADRDKWNELIKDYPPISQISFAELMTWWSSLDNCRVAQLNQNIVISYWMPGDEEGSGLSLLGTHHVDESFCSIFDWQKDKGDHPRVVHIPEFMLSKLRYPDLFACKREPNFDECILLTDDYLNIEKLVGFKRPRVKRFLAEVGEKNIEICELGLSSVEDQHAIINAYMQWSASSFNFIAKHVEESFFQTIRNADQLGIECVGIFIKGQLASFILVQEVADPDYVIIPYGKFDYDYPGIFELCLYEYAQWLHKRGIKFVNIDFDVGDPQYRTIQLSLAPHNFFRKYTITPKA